MVVHEASALAQVIVGLASGICAVWALIQARRSLSSMGDLLTTYLSDVLTVLIVLDIAFMQHGLIWGMFGAATKGGITLTRAHKEKTASLIIRSF